MTQKPFKKKSSSLSMRNYANILRALSKLGFCSRSEALQLVLDRKVTINGKPVTKIKTKVNMARDVIEVEGNKVVSAERVYLMLNKPRGLVTTTFDDQGRETVFSCIRDEHFQHISPIGRLDKASEGLLLFSNDTKWGAGIQEPKNKIDKIYHVQIDRIADEQLLNTIIKGITDEGEVLSAKNATIIRTGEKNCWLEITLQEGKNRHIRRLMNALEIEVLQLVRISIGTLQLGDLPKGQWRMLSTDEIGSFRNVISDKEPPEDKLHKNPPPRKIVKKFVKRVRPTNEKPYQTW